MIKKRLIKFVESNHLDLIFYFLASLTIIINFWKFSYLKYFGIIISVIGFLIWILGLKYLGTFFQMKPEAKKIVTKGIYSKIRHPIYFGGLLIVIGLIIYTINTFLHIYLIIYLLLFIIIQGIRAKIEERILIEKFGSKYKLYKDKTWF